MDENQQETGRSTGAMMPSELEALIALVEARVIENLTRIIERLARESGEHSP